MGARFGGADSGGVRHGQVIASFQSSSILSRITPPCSEGQFRVWNRFGPDLAVSRRFGSFRAVSARFRPPRDGRSRRLRVVTRTGLWSDSGRAGAHEACRSAGLRHATAARD
jgi:hypothetical protein